MHPRRRTALLAALVTLSLLAAGCSGGGSGSEETPDPSVDAGAGPDEAVGVVRGTVTDDESLPLAGARVGILPTGVETTTAANGSFVFVNVAAGDYQMVAGKLGFGDAAQRVTVVPDEAVEVTLVLKPIELPPEPRHETYDHEAFHVLSEVYLDFALGVAGVDATCEACSWEFAVTPNPQAFVLEIYGSHQVANPQGDEIYLYLYNHQGDPLFTQGPNNVGHGSQPLPLYAVYDKKNEAVTEAEGFQLSVYCDYFWFCLNESREIWATTWYHADPPEGWRAVPPDA